MMLMGTNYIYWGLMTKLQLQAHELGLVVETREGTDREDHDAMLALIRGVPPEFTRTLGTKAMAKQERDTLKTMR